MSEAIEGQVEAPYVPNWDMDAVLAYQRERAEQKRIVDVENGRLRAIDKRAKDAGLPVDVIKAVDKLRRREKREAEVWKDQFIRISVANGIHGPQLDMGGVDGFAQTEEQARHARVFNAEDEGFRAGKGGLDKDVCPYQPGTAEHQGWMLWWRKGVAAREHIYGKEAAGTPAGKAQPRARGRKAKANGVAQEPNQEAQALPETKALPPPETTPALRKRGRPRKEKSVENVVALPRRRGRPPGSKNKPKEAVHA